ncbi:MAG: hypothetical protein EOM68_14700, partial [Spirochaetia bacterium]|nr:hypothetical protein [Spirochaetia bacterium]
MPFTAKPQASRRRKRLPRKPRQPALRPRDARFRFLVENSRDVFFSMLLPEGRYEYISSGVTELTGAPPQRFYDTPGVFWSCVPPRWHDGMRVWIAEILRGEVREKYEYEVIDRLGRLRWIEQRLVLVDMPEGRGRILQGVASDRTEERAVALALRERAERYRLLAESWPEQVLLTLNLDTGLHEYVSPSMERVLGYRPEEFYDDPGLGLAVVAPRWQKQARQWLEEIKAGKSVAQQYLKREAEDLVSRLQEYGYDGLIAEAQNGGPYEYAVVSPSQVYMAEPQDTRFEQRVRDPYLKWEPEETSTGTIKGAPEWVKTRKDLNKLRSLLRKLVKEGESGRYWYEESAEEVWRITQGDPEKTKKLIQLLAIYSPNNNVPNNTLMAIRAYNHWASGLAEEDLHSGMGELDEKARRALYHNEDWEGRKTGSFYDNLIYELVRKHPEAFPDMDITDVGTMDLWMARAFGYQVEAYSDDKGTGKYSFSENSTRRLAAELNAKLQPGEDPWTTHQIQAAIWSSMKTRYEIDAIKEMTNKESIASGWAWVENGKVKYPTSGESEKLHKQLWRKNALEKSGTSEEVKKLVEETGFSFKQAIYDSSQVVTWEANPSTALGYEINNASGPVLSGFTAKAVSLVVDPEGADMLAGKLGVPLSFIAPGSGAYAGAVSPNAQSNLFPTRIKGEGVSFDIVRKYARAIQYIFKQDAVPFFKPDSTPLTSESAKKEMLFKTVKYTRDEDGAITKTTTISGSKFDTQAEADAFRDAYIAKKKLNPDDVAVHGGKYAKAVVMTFQDKLDRDKLISVLGELKEYLGDDAGYTKTGSNEITFINFRDDFTKAPYVYDETYLDGLGSFYEDYKDSFGIVSSTEIWTEGEYGYEHDWAEDPSGSKVLAEAGIADGSDLHSWVLGRRALFEALIKEYSGENLARVEELYRQGQLTEDTRFELSESGMAADLEGSETTTRKISDRYMQRHRTQVQAAMKRGLTVPDRVLEAYAGEEWADKELADRKLIRSFSWILPLAKDVNTPEELKALVEEELQKQGFDVLGPKTPEDIDFYKRLLELSSPTTKQMYIDSFMDIVNSDRSLRSLVQDISEARENWQGLGLPSFLWGLASKIGNGVQITDADLDMIRSYTVRNREKMATAYYASRGDTAALSKMGSEDIVYGTEEPERRAVNAA